MLTYFPLIVGKCDFIAPDCLPLCLAAVCNEVEGRNDISKHCQRHNRPECWVQLGQSNFFRSYQLQNLNRTSDFDEHRLSRWYALRKYNQGHHEFPPESVIKETKPNCIVSPQLFNHFFLKMSRKYVSEVNEKYALNQWEPLLWLRRRHQFPIPASKYRVLLAVWFDFLITETQWFLEGTPCVLGPHWDQNWLLSSSISVAVRWIKGDWQSWYFKRNASLIANCFCQ